MYIISLIISIVVCVEFDSEFMTILKDLLDISGNAYLDDNMNTSLFNYSGERGLVAKVHKYNDSLVVAFKGTTLEILGIPLGHTAIYDKELIEIMFNCCSNNKSCIEDKKSALLNSEYLMDAVRLVKELQHNNQDTNIILTGHSLGGAIASMVSLATGLKAYAFASPGEGYAMNLIGHTLPNPAVFHIGMCHDIIYKGECNGTLSPCSWLGYSFETHCHSGPAYCVESAIVPGIVAHSPSFLKWHLDINSTIHKMSENCKNDCVVVKKGLLDTISNFFRFNQD